MPRRRQREPEEHERDLGPVADPESVARTILLSKLTASAKSRRELADALAAKDVPDEMATRVLDRFEQVGLVDDAAFADTWVRSRQAGRGLSCATTPTWPTSSRSGSSRSSASVPR